MTSFLMGVLLIIKESSFQLLVTNQLISTCTLTFEISSHYVVGYQVVQPCTSKEYSQNIQFMVTSPYYSCESQRNIYFSTASHLTSIKMTSAKHIINRYWALQLVRTKVMARAMTIFFFFFAWEVVKDKKISRTLKQ